MPSGGYNEILDGDFVHNDDIIDGGPSPRGVRYIIVDQQKTYERNIGYIRESIELRKKREKEEGLTAVV